MKVLGVADGHCASACLLVDGVVTHALQEERMVNIKNESGLPGKAIEWILKDSHSLEDLDSIALSTFFIHEAEWYRKQAHWEKTRRDYLINKLTWPIRKRFDPYFTQRLDTRKKQIVSLFSDLGAKIPPIKVIEHHEAHAASAYYGSPFEKPIIMTADGSGDGLSATVNVTLGGQLKRVQGYECTRDESPGELYSMVTHFMGFRPWDHEYKLMGMAPYSPMDPRVFDGLMDMMAVEKGRFKARISADFAYGEIKKLLYRKRFDMICSALQEWFETVMAAWFTEIHDAIGNPEGDEFACAGGDFMNVKTNMRLAQLPFVKDIWFMPSAGDESTSIGAAMQVYAEDCLDHGENPRQKIAPLKDLYLGPEACGEDAEAILDKESAVGKIEYHKEPRMETQITEILNGGGIVARCAGRLEFGARALGNRSILADPRSLDSIDRLNAQIKQRDFWMPFTPSVMEEQAPRYVMNPKKFYTPYMILCLPSTPDGRKDLKAAMHRYDFTIRPQMVRRSWNEDYYRLLYRWLSLTGIGGMLNTSFNLHGYPIVKDIQTALWTMEDSKLEYIAAGPYLIRKGRGK